MISEIPPDSIASQSRVIFTYGVCGSAQRSCAVVRLTSVHEVYSSAQRSCAGDIK